MRRRQSHQLNNSYPAFICGFVCISAPSYFLEMYSKPCVKNHDYLKKKYFCIDLNVCNADTPFTKTTFKIALKEWEETQTVFSVYDS